jgi:predicted NBD/HSP70 family sugar kinase
VRLDIEGATTSADLRAHNLARLLRAVHDGGGTRTRAELTRQLSLARGTATVLVRDLADRNLIEELQIRADEAVHRSRGRPTGVPSPHPYGPVALAVDLRDDSFSVASFELTGRGVMLERQERQSASGTDLLNSLSRRLAAHRTALGPRLIGIGVAVPSPVSQGRMVQPGLAAWDGVDVSEVLALGPVPVLVGNDARLAGLAEARRGGLRDLSVALHLHLATGVGGVLLSRGGPLTGAHGAAGEFGHLPLTGGTELCRCGCVGCWELDAGSHGLLRRAGRPEHGDRVELALAVIRDAGRQPACARALAEVAGALGRGMGSLVNAHDPEAIGLSGLGRDIYQAAPEAVRAGYVSTLMRFRRDAPPPLIPSRLGDLGALTGAAELIFDAFLTPRGLMSWPAAPVPAAAPLA